MKIDELFKMDDSDRKPRKRVVDPKKDNPVARFIRDTRIIMGLSQADLALRCGVPLITVRSIEQGKRTVRMDILNRVLRFFNSQVGVVALEHNQEGDLT